jgi:Skp family chaperone for outer membrane proteins
MNEEITLRLETFNDKEYILADDCIKAIGIHRKTNTKLHKEIKRLKEEYVMLQNASDEVEEEKDKEIERLQDLCNKYEKEHKTTYEIWKKDIYLYNSLVDRIDRAIDYIEQNDIMKVSKEEKTKGSIFCDKELLDILKGSDKE